jgi:hypothetical protein
VACPDAVSQDVRTLTAGSALGGQLGLRLPRSAPLGTQEQVHSKSRCALEPGLDRWGQLMSQNRQRFAFVMFLLQAGQPLLALGVVTQDQDRCFRKGPFEVRVAAFLA